MLGAHYFEDIKSDDCDDSWKKIFDPLINEFTTSMASGILLNLKWIDEQIHFSLMKLIEMHFLSSFWIK